ncbi:uncharacterized protein LOC113782475 [Coffea eugenioides]|uniref:uncharacterized protein LOC113782475 n=1 Tax=Coffea eugenioides TaxID=49369 RepID=UPI000F5CD496|nr:uncharacterized protein LOC113710082 [Coffea arabica]XP_027184167.1 uncharacterized protein LOC113782475 [Coffea eugenioides]
MADDIQEAQRQEAVGRKERIAAKSRGLRAGFLFDRTLRSMLRCELYYARARLTCALVIEEGFWRQKARVKWLLDGDRSSKYFHSLVTEKRRRAVIHRVRKTNGKWIEGEPQIGDTAVRFFQELFTAEGSSTSNAILETIPKLVTDKDNSLLTEIPSLTEVKTIVFAMDGKSAAGRMGSQGNSLPSHGRWWPRMCTGQLRHIADNFLLAQELLTDIKKSNRGGNVVIKLDIMKTYDRVSWSFLLQVLWHFGFSETWIDMIWRLISNVWFSVLVNGAPQGFFRSSRGLRQGDPISAALFVIGVEVLSRALNSLVTQRGFTPFRVPPQCPVVSHLAFADDVIIFPSGGRSSLKLVKRVLDDYSVASGQRVNPQKSCFLTHPWTPSQRAAVVGQVYYADTYNAVAARILSWKNQSLSAGGRLVLIKRVLSSMPIHLLAAASPLKGILLALEKLFINFLWGHRIRVTNSIGCDGWICVGRGKRRVLACGGCKRSSTLFPLNSGGNFSKNSHYGQSLCRRNIVQGSTFV